MMTESSPQDGDDPPPSRGHRLVVIGGGVVGCAIARELAPEYDVTLLERDAIASGATGLAAGEITTLPSYSDRPAIGRYSLEFVREYDGHGDFEFTELPGVEPIPPEREGEARRRAERLADDGLPVTFLDTATAAQRYPTISFDGRAGAVEFEGNGFVDPYTFATTLAADAADRGATIETGVEVRDVLVEGDAENRRVAGVETNQGAYDAAYVIAAAGWRTRELLLDHVEVPVRPYRTQCLSLAIDEELPSSFPLGWLPDEHLYFRPEHNGNLLVGGFSFATEEPETASPNADSEFKRHVAEVVPRALHVGDPRIVDGWAGVDGATPDTRPIVDAPDDAPAGLIVSTGFHGRGVMTAPIAAAVVRGLVGGESVPFSTAPFSIDRFDSRTDEFQFVSISAE